MRKLVENHGVNQRPIHEMVYGKLTDRQMARESKARGLLLCDSTSCNVRKHVLQRNVHAYIKLLKKSRAFGVCPDALCLAIFRLNRLALSVGIMWKRCGLAMKEISVQKAAHRMITCRKAVVFYGLVMSNGWSVVCIFREHASLAICRR